MGSQYYTHYVVRRKNLYETTGKDLTCMLIKNSILLTTLSVYYEDFRVFISQNEAKQDLFQYINLNIK